MKNVRGLGVGERLLAACAVCCFVALFLLAVRVHSTVPSADTWVHALAVRSRHSGDLAWVRVVTNGGATVVVWPLIVVAALVFPRWDRPRRWLTAVAVAAVAGGGIGVRLLISDVVRRARPPQVDWAGTAGGFAFPSGHTTAATIGAGLLAWSAARHISPARTGLRRGVWALAVVYAVVVGWTRIWLGVHWPLDVLGGWLLGAGWLAAMASVISRYTRVPTVPESGPAAVSPSQAT